jgi:predicted DsbA family dithiol-disulfide isomerase
MNGKLKAPSKKISMEPIRIVYFSDVLCIWAYIAQIRLEDQIDSGEAYAQLSKDCDLVKDYGVTVSPTLIFNEGHQRLNGNVGCRVIEANIRELLHNPPGEQSWC